MTKQEIMDRLEEIKGVVDTDFLNRHTIEGVVKDIDNLLFHLIGRKEMYAQPKVQEQLSTPVMSEMATKKNAHLKTQKETKALDKVQT